MRSQTAMRTKKKQTLAQKPRLHGSNSNVIVKRRAFWINKTKANV